MNKIFFLQRALLVIVTAAQLGCPNSNEDHREPASNAQGQEITNDQCVNNKIATFRKEMGDIKPISPEKLLEWESQCEQNPKESRTDEPIAPKVSENPPSYNPMLAGEASECDKNINILRNDLITILEKTRAMPPLAKLSGPLKEVLDEAEQLKSAGEFTKCTAEAQRGITVSAKYR